MASFSVKAVNLGRIKLRLQKLPDAASEALQRQLNIEGNELVGAIKRAMGSAYADSGDHDHERLRDSVRNYVNPDRAISQTILADAKDEDGKFIGSNVEAGHRAVDGTHVAARPAFFPIYRARKKAMQNRLRAAGRKAVKQTWGA